MVTASPGMFCGLGDEKSALFLDERHAAFHRMVLHSAVRANHWGMEAHQVSPSLRRFLSGSNAATINRPERIEYIKQGGQRGANRADGGDRSWNDGAWYRPDLRNGGMRRQ